MCEDNKWEEQKKKKAKKAMSIINSSGSIESVVTGGHSTQDKMLFIKIGTR